MSGRIVIVGGGLAAGTAAAALRDAGYDGDVVLHAAEPHLPYERPPLSKGYLAGDAEADSMLVHPASWYAENDVEVRTGSRVERIDADGHTVTAGGATESFDRLLIATGASPRHLAVADESGAPVAYLRTREDSDRLRSVLSPGHRIAILGGGFLGLEVAAAARTAGADVTVLEALDQPLLRVLGPEMGAMFADLHREHGVDLRLGAKVTGFDGDGRTARLTVEGSPDVDADLLVIGIGASPDVALAEAAGLAVDNGILVDERMRASRPDIYAAGDAARAHHPVLGRSIRVEHWDNAIRQGRVAGRAMAGDEDAVATDLPYFFTDQYDLGMEYVGDVGPEGYDEVVIQGDLAKRVFKAFWVAGGKVVAAMQANDWDASDSLRPAIGKSLAEIS
ncbi:MULTISPECIES: FAD-dependent oxidoreductase [unclassified Nocardioides]|uniref:NAD(P)/FAD-dependent oxidoreductase n=1 Tax=unclassified Nocardioides TaxID=2615069 RepID=UPI0000571DAD|nr:MULTISPECIES: FAD-dependent oxidoreductase [unclassified Nocardioides]ABL82857.1 FAD-dependent pyridine nucleotide-disulfide oxidoreductase [Nocardioides sp. JS614]